jgi:hypothetical protein
VLTSQTIATEIVRSVAGTLGLIAAVPITTWLAASLARRNPKPKAPKEKDPKRPKPKPEPTAAAWDEDDSPYPPSQLR